jgi:hypothetical protein
MSIGIANAAQEPGDVRVEFHPVPVPHGKLLLRISPMGLPASRIPRPNLMRIEQVQLAYEFAARQRLQREQTK